MLPPCCHCRRPAAIRRDVYICARCALQELAVQLGSLPELPSRAPP